MNQAQNTNARTAGKYVIRNATLPADVAARYFSRKGFEFNAALVTADQAHSFRTQRRALRFLDDVAAAGYAGYRIEFVGGAK